MFHETDEIEHSLRDRAGRPKEVERHAGGCALSERPNRLLELGGIDIAVEDLLGLVAAVDAVDVPEPVACEERELPIQRRDAVIGVDSLAVSAIANFVETALDLRVILAGHQIDPEWIERIGCRNRQRIKNIAVAD